MPRKKGKSISFDAMVKFFMHTYDIPTKRDVDKIMARLERIEALVASVPAARVPAATRRPPVKVLPEEPEKSRVPGPKTLRPAWEAAVRMGVEMTLAPLV